MGPLTLPPEWRVLKNRPFLGAISQQNIRSQQRPRIQELGNLYTPDSPTPEDRWAFVGSLSSVSPTFFGISPVPPLHGDQCLKTL